MKSLTIKTVLVFLTFTAVFKIFTFNVSAFEGEDRFKDAIILHIGSSKAYVNNKVVYLDPNNQEIKPIIYQDRTLIPIRFVSENLGAKVEWVSSKNIVSIDYADIHIELTSGSNEMEINGTNVILDTEPILIEGRVFVPVRAISEAFGKKVFWDYSGLIIISDVEKIIDSSTERQLIDSINTLFEEPIKLKEQQVWTDAGWQTAKIIEINPKAPEISFEVNIPGTRLNQTQDFEAQVRAKGAFAAVNANFFSAFDEIKDPIGNVMVNGKLIYGVSGFTTVGITKDKDIIFSKPATFINGYVDGKKQNEVVKDKGFEYNVWSAYEVNNRIQAADSAILYTPERGTSIDITIDGYVAMVEDNIVKENYFVKAPSTVRIPQNGYTVYFSQQNAEQWHGNEALKVGKEVSYEYYLFANTNPNFKWGNMEWAIAGGPDLVSNGKITSDAIQTGFADELFTTLRRARTAIGIDSTGHLLLVQVPSATIAELKNIMLVLGAREAINLDGALSSGMYYDGKVLAKPGRELETILYVYLK